MYLVTFSFREQSIITEAFVLICNDKSSRKAMEPATVGALERDTSPQ